MTSLLLPSQFLQVVYRHNLGHCITHLVSILVKALCYKKEGRGFETRWGEVLFSIFLILPAALGPGVYSASNRNEHQKQKTNVCGE
jgi:hypothetical protein